MKSDKRLLGKKQNLEMQKKTGGTRIVANERVKNRNTKRQDR